MNINSSSMILKIITSNILEEAIAYHTLFHKKSLLKNVDC